MIHRQWRWMGAVLLAGVIASTASAGIESVADLTHTVERSRVLSMRIIKAHALLGLHNQFKNPDKELATSYATLKTNLNAVHDYLKAHADQSDPRLLPLIERAHKEFARLTEGDLLHDNRPERAIDFFKALEKSRVQINKAAEILTEDTSQRDPIFYTTRLSTIAQKMAAVYLYKTWGIALPKLDEHFAMMTRKSAKSIKALNAYAQKSAAKLTPKQRQEIADQIAAMKDQLTFFIMARKFKSFIPSLLYNKANAIEEENRKIETILGY